jgi:hypothetical protein
LRKLLYLLAWLLLLTNLFWMILASFHFVNTSDGWQVLAKTHLSLVDTFADTRTWTRQDLAAHPLLAQRLESARQQTILAGIRARAEVQPPAPAARASEPLPPLPPLPANVQPHDNSADNAPVPGGVNGPSIFDHDISGK